VKERSYANPAIAKPVAQRSKKSGSPENITEDFNGDLQESTLRRQLQGRLAGRAQGRTRISPNPTRLSQPPATCPRVLRPHKRPAVVARFQWQAGNTFVDGCWHWPSFKKLDTTADSVEAADHNARRQFSSLAAPVRRVPSGLHGFGLVLGQRQRCRPATGVFLHVPEAEHPHGDLTLPYTKRWPTTSCRPRLTSPSRRHCAGARFTDSAARSGWHGRSSAHPREPTSRTMILDLKRQIEQHRWRRQWA